MRPIALECGRCGHEWSEPSRTVPENCPACLTDIPLAQLGWDDETGTPLEDLEQDAEDDEPDEDYVAQWEIDCDGPAHRGPDRVYDLYRSLAENWTAYLEEDL